MNTKTLFWLIAVLSLLSVSCDKNSPAGHNSGNNGEKPDEPLVELPELEETDDVCTKMDDLNFMAYCYDKCNNATSFAGLEYFTNLKSFASSSVQKADFRYNKNLETIDCSDSDIESVDLRYNDKLTSISFQDCELLASISLPKNLTSIGEYAFDGCSSLASITIPESVTSIGEYAFDGCSSLASITIPESVTSIGEYAFSGCKSLESIIISEGVTSIGEYAFLNCWSLKSVDASQCVNLISIKSNAFISNYLNFPLEIKEFLLGTSNPPSVSYGEYGGDAFDYMPDAVLKVPAQSVEAYKNSDWADYFGTIEAL